MTYQLYPIKIKNNRGLCRKSDSTTNKIFHIIFKNKKLLIMKICLKIKDYIRL